MQTTTIKTPLARRIAMVLSGVVLMALVSMVSSVLVAEATSGNAAAINSAGSLRMHSWQIASFLQSHNPAGQKITELADDFERRLNRSELLSATHKSNEQLEKSYENIAMRWQTELHPLLQAGDAEGYLQAATGFVSEIDAMVNLLEQSTESKIRVLRLIQFLGLAFTLLVVYLTIYTLHTNMSAPLNQMVTTAEEIARKNFSVRFKYNNEDELGLLGQTLNQMAEELSKLYGELEQRVEDKTEKLSRSNQSLQLLYEATRKLNCTPQDLQERLPGVVQDLQQVAGLKRAVLCLIKEGADNAYQYLTSDKSGKPDFCTAPSCAGCVPKQSAFHEPLLVGCSRMVKFPVATQITHFGHILVELNGDEDLPEQQRQLIDAIADIIASSITLARQADQESKLLLMEERAVIARELHDSLAQSLSYQKIQVTRVRKLHQRRADEAEIFSALDDLQQGLNTAYRRLRELLTTFRLKPESADLESGVRNAVDEFSERGDTEISLEFKLQHCPLNANEEVHLLQIIREGLSNVVQHSQAQLAVMHLQQLADGQIEISLSDNGIGIPDRPEKTAHFGMVILRERAQKLNGELNIHRNESGGTTIELRFLPEFLRRGLRVK